MTSQTRDIQLFEDTLRDLHQDFQEHPFHYGNENPIMPELYRRLRTQLTPETAPLTYRQDHSNMDDWRNREMFKRIERENQEIPRVRPEVRFYDEGIWGGAKTDFDLVVFPGGNQVVMQGKKEGIGNFVDIEHTELSVLCEIKHSMNMSGRFRNGGETDVQALAEYPGEVGRRYFVFMDWWPQDGYGKTTFEKDLRQLEDKVGELGCRVDVVYLPRSDDLEIVRGVCADGVL
ncbi:hypothetical protein [Natronolimnohabitans innermongolicus]|uniref:Uncharacterized protein n=1 Tax=Natronolimnohabitans innermongolicus JCM 12255 TaxID=1227499 RepID=L9X9F2_9EURY|nr:hypothetical protein [Natronolimnohabitans innermongolicus]ELY58350.1 hypothetical protein C493_07234 [Natronolimnohabitans innermongolicus JCM 12255]